MKTTRDIFKRKDGMPSKYAFICGHVLTFEVKGDLFTTKLEVYREAGCETWQIRGFKYVNGSSSCDKIFWHTKESINEALKTFREEKKKIKQGAYNKCIIKDWAGNTCFKAKQFATQDDAESYLSETLGDNYDTDRQEYYIEEII